MEAELDDDDSNLEDGRYYLPSRGKVEKEPDIHFQKTAIENPIWPFQFSLAYSTFVSLLENS
jgi:hypothetical protein